VSKDFIFTGDHYLKAEGGGVIEPFVPFDCTVMWRETLLPRFRRRVMTIPDYRLMIERRHTLVDLINACARRELRPGPIDIVDADWYARPMNAVLELMSGRGEALDSRYGLTREDVAHVSTTIAMTRVQEHVIAYIIDDTGMNEDELHAALVEVLMAPLVDGDDEGVPADAEAASSDDSNDNEIAAVEAPIDTSDEVEAAEVDAEAEEEAGSAKELSPIEARRQVAKEMRDSGSSIAAIAAALDVSESTVQRDLSK
jgi:hypothetical protein